MKCPVCAHDSDVRVCPECKFPRWPYDSQPDAAMGLRDTVELIGEIHRYRQRYEQRKGGG